MKRSFLVGLGFVVAAASGWSAEQQISVTQKPLSPEQRQQLNAAAVRVLNKIADTRFAIRMKNTNLAKQDIDDAAAALGTVANLSPTATVRDKVELARKHLEYQSTSKVQQDLIPVAADIDRISEYVSVPDVKRHLDLANKSLAKGDKKAARDELKLVSNALVYREVDLPIIRTQAKVSEARNALYGGQPKKADNALKVAENNMPVFEAAVVSQPAPAQNQRAPSSTSEPQSK